jgi:hypothetical protein
VHNLKQDAASISTEAGMQIDFSDEQKINAAFSIRRRLEFPSNVPVSSIEVALKVKFRSE